MKIRAWLLLCLLSFNPLLLAAAADNTAVVETPVAVNTPELEQGEQGEHIPVAAAAQVKDTAFGGHDLSPWGMYQAADVVVKSVMVGLLLASVLTWTVWLFKTVQLRLASKQARGLLQQLSRADSFAEARLVLLRPSSKSAGGLLLLQASQQELDLSANGPSSDEGLKERVAARLERVQAALTAQMNRGTGVLATIGSVAPFVGLFGTVWGIMNSFIGIAQTQTTNLAVVAPGIAEALLATALGLVAAIPAVVIYNHFSRAIAAYRAQLADTVTAVMILISRDLDRLAPEARCLNADLMQLKDAG